MKRIILGICLSFCFSAILAQKTFVLQQGVGATGFDGAEIDGVYFNAVIGQTSNSTLANAGLVLTQGFLQPIEKSGFTFTSSKQAEWTLNVYPNPARDRLYLSIPGEVSMGKSLLQVTDMNGRMVYQEYWTPQGIREIDIEHLPASTYLISLQNETYTLKTLIVKITSY